MRSYPSISFENYPDSLFEQCAKYIVHHLETLTVIDPITKRFCLKDGLTLPSEICEKLFEAYQQSGNTVTDEFISIFKHPVARLKRARLKNPDITDSGLRLLLSHNLSELELTNAVRLTEEALYLINEKGSNLQSLSLNNTIQILPDSLISDPRKRNGRYNAVRRGYIIKGPNLRRLTIQRLNIIEGKTYFELLLQPLTKLTHLDLSNSSYLEDLSYLQELEFLSSLVLFNAKLHYPDAFDSLMKLRGLKHLDISQISQKYGTFPNPNQILSGLVENLPKLVSLDISGTNLAGTGVAEHSLTNPGDDSFPTDIPGLRCRYENPLEFLGLFKTHYEACRRHDILAKCITGDANEEQILNAVFAYIDRPDVLQKALNNLFHLLQFENCLNICVATKLILESMDKHSEEKQIQIAGSASLYHIARVRHSCGVKTQHRIIRAILNGMIAFRDDETMIRNGCLTLFQFNIPDDVIFDYDRLARVLLYILNKVDQETVLVLRIAIYLLNSLACQVEKRQKLFLGELGAITNMLSLIKDRLDNQVFDDVLEVAWSTMWNVTDETALNCERFLDGNGMDLFLGCLAMFPSKDELLRNMMGLLGNVAEVEYLRPRLMCTRFVSVFVELLESVSDGIEVSYNAAGVLAHMCSDGPEAWTIPVPTREVVLKKMVTAIERWDLSIERNINYRSFQPILGLLTVNHTLECQHWAVWALANLTRVYPRKYCFLFEGEGGIELLKQIIWNDISYDRIKELAQIVLDNCKQYKMRNAKI